MNKQLEELRNLLATFDKDDFASLVYEQLKQDAGITGEFPAMIPVIVAAMEKAFNPKKTTRHGWPKLFIEAAMIAYFTSRTGDEVQSNPENLQQLMAFATSDPHAIPGYPEVTVKGKGNNRKVYYRDDYIGTWEGLRQAFEQANEVQIIWKTPN